MAWGRSEGIAITVLPDAPGKVGTTLGVDCSAMMVSGSHVFGGGVLVAGSSVVRIDWTVVGISAVEVGMAAGTVDEIRSETSLTSDGRPLEMGRSVGVAVGSDTNDVSLPMEPDSEGRTLGREVSLTVGRDVSLALTGGRSVVVELPGTSDSSGGNELIEVSVGGSEVTTELSTGGVDVSLGGSSLSVELGVMLGSRTVGSEVISGSEVTSAPSLVVVASTRVVVGSAS